MRWIRPCPKFVFLFIIISMEPDMHLGVQLVASEAEYFRPLANELNNMYGDKESRTRLREIAKRLKTNAIQRGFPRLLGHKSCKLSTASKDTRGRPQVHVRIPVELGGGRRHYRPWMAYHLDIKIWLCTRKSSLQSPLQSRNLHRTDSWYLGVNRWQYGQEKLRSVFSFDITEWDDVLHMYSRTMLHCSSQSWFLGWSKISWPVFRLTD